MPSNDLEEMQHLFGWSGADHPDLLRESFDLFGDEFAPLKIYGAMPLELNSRSMLYEVGRKVLGRDTENYAQKSADCIAFSAKNAGEYLQFYQIANGDNDVFTNLFPPYMYGCGRVFVGGAQLGKERGSLGIWQAKAVMEYGVIPSNISYVPKYSAEVADQWGSFPGPPTEFISLGKQYIIKSAASVATWEEMGQALMNGYPISVASDVGYDLLAQSDGYMHNTAFWKHCMTIIGFDNGNGIDIEPHACLLNSWGGSIHGKIKDFRTGEMWPAGTIRARKADVERALAQAEGYAYSGFDGFPAQDLPRELFDIF